MDFVGFQRAAEHGQLPRVTLVHGPDPQLLDDALATASRTLFADVGLATFGREVLDGTEVSLDDVLRSAATLPMMTPARLVAVRHAQALDATPAFAAYVADPSPTTCLLLLADESLEARRDRKRHWLLDAVPSAAVVTLATRQGRTLEDWLRQRAAQEGLTVSADAARLLVEWVGDDTAALLGETRKAALAGVSGAGTVGVKDVTAVVGEQRLSGVFDLTRAIERHDVGLALRTLDRLLSSEEPMRLLALLSGEVRLGWRIKDLAGRGQAPDQIARAVNRPPGVVQARLATVTALSTATLAAMLSRCWNVERRLKSGGEKRAELATLVAALATERG